MVVELLLTDQPPKDVAHDPDPVLEDRGAAERQEESVSAPQHPVPDRSHPAMAVNLDACIQCNLCVRACRECRSTT